MSNDYIPQDYQARKTALSAARSFIVQAPAGAGKTGLLTQRFLKLLSVVEHPESIVAITFTRKAAAEMRERIIVALNEAKNSSQPETPHEAQTWRLAQKVIEKDEQYSWGLLENPSRLRVQTFDALSAWLAGQMPLLSEFGSRPNTCEDASAIYAEAALNCISQLKSESIESDAVAILLSHLDNRVGNLIHLLSSMLARRDQWLRHVADKDNPQLTREPIEQALQEIVEEHLVRLESYFPSSLANQLLSLIRFAADNLDADSPFYVCRDLTQLPAADAAGFSQWQAIATFLMTQKGEWRSNKGITKRIGFPAQDKDKKQQMFELLDDLRENVGLLHLLQDLEKLPAASFKDTEWVVLNALFILLRYVVLELKLSFQSHGEVDFAEISLKSLFALGRPDDPSELLLRLDYQIQHLLVDEFQDTSINQFQLLEMLTSGWEPGDGRSLFLVGDPMQSIYRFREAEVGLFLKAKNQGIGAIQPEFLQLSVNFRSQAGIIDWVNRAFPEVLPHQDDMYMGAVSYAPSESAKALIPGDAVSLYPQIERNDQEEAQQVLKIIRQAQVNEPDGNIAILVSGRAHLKEIVALMRQNGIPFNAVKIDALSNKPVVKDLFALTQALLHLDDRIHWLATLRAPWCGLDLADLLVLAEGLVTAGTNESIAEDSWRNQSSTIMANLSRVDCVNQLSDDGQCRVRRILPILQDAIQQRNRKSLRDWVEGVWIALGGPALLNVARNNKVGVNYYCDDDPQTALMNIEEYFRLLEQLDVGAEPEDFYQLENQVERLYAKSDPEADNSIQIMTIHAAKGLEFDTVIVPGLGRAPGKDSAQLLYWLETNRAESSQLLFAPISGTHSKYKKSNDNRTAQYIKKLETDKRHLEVGRLLYVAVTRAKKYLHLIGHVSINANDELKPPPSGSLLHDLWPVVECVFQAKWNNMLPTEINPSNEESFVALESISKVIARQRLASQWSCPEPEMGLTTTKVDETAQNNNQLIEFNWSGDIARHVGTVVHRILEHIAGLEDHQRHSIERYSPIARQFLSDLGLSGEELHLAGEKVMQAIDNTLNDEKGQWILSNRHEQAACELALSVVEDDEVRHIIIDRTFIDQEGTRWIVDYKTGSHSGGGLEEFLAEEELRYREQLKGYANALKKIDERPIKTGLYFPLLKQFREIF